MGQNTNEGVYFTLKDYNLDFQSNLDSFLAKFEEANEYDFIEKEIREYGIYKIVLDYIDINFNKILLESRESREGSESGNYRYLMPQEFMKLNTEDIAYSKYPIIVKKIASSTKLSTNDTIISIRIGFNKIIKFLESKQINSNSDDNSFKKIKAVYIDKIKQAEELAISTFDISLKQDFFTIEQQQINEENRIDLTRNYLTDSVLKYQNIRNLYKSANDQFYFMTTVAENKLTEDDRLDFIATVLSSFAINPNSESSEINEENLGNIFDQLKNIDSIIYETKIAELKFNYVKNKLKEFESNKKTSSIVAKKQKKAYKLDNDFSEQIRLQFSTVTFLFDCEEDKIEIVPKELSHDFLLNKFDIDEDILKFYYSPTRQLILDVEYQKMKDSGYHGNIDRVLKPYPINIFGAYYARKKLHTQISFIANKENYYINTKKVTHFSDLIPYFIEYSNGFKKGFSDFEKDCIKPYLNEYSDKSDFTSKIYEYISKKIVFEHDWLYNGGSFTLTLNKNNSENYEIIEAFKDGLKQGYFYKAWSITLGNSNVYSKYFKEYYSKQETTKENLHIPKIVINDDESGFKKATIEDYLEQFKDVIINNTYDLLVDALFQYFTTGSFPVLDRKINFKRINKKRLGWELKELYKSLKTDNLDIEYFRFAKDNINLYANEIIENERFLKSKFYKAFTTNPPK